MRTRRQAALQRRPAPPAQGQLLELDDDSLAAILAAAAAEEDVEQLANTCMRLCRLARARLPSHITVHLPNVDCMLTTPGPPFSGCTELKVVVSAEAESLGRHPWVLQRALDLRMLHHVELSGHHQSILGSKVLCRGSDWLLPGLEQLRGLLALRYLELTVQGFCSVAAAAVGQLTQLSRLNVHDWDGCVVGSVEPAAAATAAECVAQPVDVSAWAGLKGLRQLTVHGFAVAPPLGPGAMGGLPSTLQDLHLGMCLGQAYWVQQLRELPQLTRLVMEHAVDQCNHPGAHPAAVTQAAAGHCPNLVHLQLTMEAPSGMSEKTWDGSLPLLPAAAVAPAPDPWCFTTALASLTHLVTLDCMTLDCKLHVTQPDHWELLCQLSRLTQLRWCHVTCPPAAGQQLPALRRMGMSTTLPRAELVALLTGTVPNLEELLLLVHLEEEGLLGAMQPQPQLQPQQEEEQQQEEGWEEQQQDEQEEMEEEEVTQQQQQQQQLGPEVTMHALRTVTLMYNPADVVPAAAMAAHCAAFLPTLGQVAALDLRACFRQEQGPWLPELGHLTALTRLHLGPINQEHSLQVEDLVCLLQPVKQQLQELTLSELASINPRVVLALQHELGALRELQLEEVGRLATAQDPRSEEQLMQQLKRCVRPGLQLWVRRRAIS